MTKVSLHPRQRRYLHRRGVAEPGGQGQVGQPRPRPRHPQGQEQKHRRRRPQQRPPGQEQDAGEPEQDQEAVSRRDGRERSGQRPAAAAQQTVEGGEAGDGDRVRQNHDPRPGKGEHYRKFITSSYHTSFKPAKVNELTNYTDFHLLYKILSSPLHV